MRVRVTEHVAGSTRSREDRLAGEEPLEVRVRWPGTPSRRVLVTMRTPGHDFELAAGVLFAEGVLRPGELREIGYCDDDGLDHRHRYNVVTATLDAEPDAVARAVVDAPRQGGTVTAASSACGVCGADSVESVLAGARHVPRRPTPQERRVPAATLRALPGRLRDHQRVFETTGGLHAAGLFDAHGDALVVREDIGRHNAVDKVVGRWLLDGFAGHANVLTVSGRLGYEIVQKAVVAAIPVVVAVGAPSSLAVELADATGLTVVGFTGSERAVVYTHPERVGV